MNPTKLRLWKQAPVTETESDSDRPWVRSRLDCLFVRCAETKQSGRLRTQAGRYSLSTVTNSRLKVGALNASE